MKFVFLDIDGVLNYEGLFVKRYKDGSHKIIKNAPKFAGWLMGVDKHCIKNLRYILRNTNSKIILTSSWKTSYIEYQKHKRKGSQGEYLVQNLKKYGVEIYDTTFNFEDDEWGGGRGKGILKYVRQYETESWVVIDDEIFEDYDIQIKQHLVQTDFYKGGLTKELAKKAISILEN